MWRFIMKRFFSTLSKAEFNSSSGNLNKQLSSNMAKMRQRCRDAEELIKMLPPEQRPKPVKFEDIEKTLTEAELRQKTQSIY